VTLTLIGPDNGWLALGFDSSGHDGQDVVMFDGSNLVDRQFTGGLSEPTTDSSNTNGWTVTSNTTNAGTRTVVATRARVSSDSGDYDFSDAPTNILVVGAYENNFDISNRHTNKGTSTLSFQLLGSEDFNKLPFSMSPNPATSNLKIVLPSNLNKASIKIFDMLGRQIFTGNLNGTHFSIIDISTWSRGTYLVKVSNGAASQTKRFIKQ